MVVVVVLVVVVVVDKLSLANAARKLWVDTGS